MLERCTKLDLHSNRLPQRQWQIGGKSQGIDTNLSDKVLEPLLELLDLSGHLSRMCVGVVNSNYGWLG